MSPSTHHKEYPHFCGRTIHHNHTWEHYSNNDPLSFGNERDTLVVVVTEQKEKHPLLLKHYGSQVQSHWGLSIEPKQSILPQQSYNWLSIGIKRQPDAQGGRQPRKHGIKAHERCASNKIRLYSHANRVGPLDHHKARQYKRTSS